MNETQYQPHNLQPLSVSTAFPFRAILSVVYHTQVGKEGWGRITGDIAGRQLTQTVVTLECLLYVISTSTGVFQQRFFNLWQDNSFNHYILAH